MRGAPLVAERIELVRVAIRDWPALSLESDVPLLAADQEPLIARLPQRETKAIVALLAAAAEVERIARKNVSARLGLDYLRIRFALGAACA